MFRRQSPTQLITGIDIGSTAIHIVVGQYKRGNNDMAFNIMGAAEAPSAGISRGEIKSIEETVSAVAHALEQVERVTGVPVEHAWVGITGTHVISQKGRGVVSVAKSDGEISDEDVLRVIDAAKRSATPLSYEVLHVLPQTYTVDGQTGIRDPVGMTGMKLEAETNIIHGLSSHIQNISRAIYRMGLDVDGVISTAVATGDAVTNMKQKELGVAVATIGGATTSLVVFEGGQPIYSVAIPIGSDHITNDLALGLRIPIETAERIKIDHGSAVAKAVPRKDFIEVNLGDSTESVSRYYAAQIIEARTAEILEHIDLSLNEIGRRGALPAGILFSGGGGKLSGLTDLARRVLCLPAALGYPIDTTSVTFQTNDLAFAPVIGIVRFAARLEMDDSGGTHHPIARLSGLRDGLRKVGQWLLP